MSAHYDNYCAGAKLAQDRLVMLERREPDPREKRLPVTVADRCRRARRMLDQSSHAEIRAANARRAGNLDSDAESMSLAHKRLDDANYELDLADELIQGLAQ